MALLFPEAIMTPARNGGSAGPSNVGVTLMVETETILR